MNPLRIILAIILVNVAGIILRYFELDTYFIFIGFRFHLSTVLPFILLINKDGLKILSSAFRKPVYRRKILPLSWVILSLIIVLLILFVPGKIKPGDPDYFYEFGLSSVFDFPLYLIWNFPQLCFLFFTLLILSGMNKFPFFSVFIGLILLFGYELIPFGSAFSPGTAVSLVLMSLIASIFVINLQNIYWFAIIVFSSIWSIILLFGSRSELLINIFFAKEYSSWDGFFKTTADIVPYIVPSFFLILLIIISFYSLTLRKSVR